MRIYQVLSKPSSQDGPLSRFGGIAASMVGTAGLMGLNAVLVFGITALLARWLGKGHYGIYTYSLAWMKLLMVPATLGLGPLLTRNVAVFRSQSDWGKLRGLLTWSNRYCLLAATCFALLASGIAYWVLHLKGYSLLTFWLSMALVPLMTLIRLRQATLRGLAHVVLSQFPERLVQPVLYIGLVSVAQTLVTNGIAPVAMGLYLASTVVSFAIGVAMVLRRLPPNLTDTEPEYSRRAWLASSWPLLATSIVTVLNEKAGILVLGTMLGPEPVGLYGVVSGVVTTIGLLPLAAAMALAPTTAQHYASGRRRAVQSAVTRVTRLVFLLMILAATALVLSAQYALGLFGPGFTQGRGALTMLVLGQVAASVAGTPIVLLQMTGYEKHAAAGSGLAATLNIVLASWLVPQQGIAGAAIAATVSLVSGNIVLAALLRKLTGIDSTVVGGLVRSRR